MTNRRFPASWRVDKMPRGCGVRDANGQALVYVYAREYEAEALHTSQIQDMVKLTGQRSKRPETAKRESNMLRRDLLKSAMVGSAALTSGAGAELEGMAAEFTKEFCANDGFVASDPGPPRPPPTSPRAATARSCSAAVGNITSPDTAASSVAFTTKAST